MFRKPGSRFSRRLGSDIDRDSKGLQRAVAGSVKFPDSFPMFELSATRRRR
jgi:hypothetical protein